MTTGGDVPDGHEAADMEARMPALAQMLTRALPPTIGFMLIAIETGVRPSKVAYISSVERDDGATAMKMLLAKWGSR